MLCFIKKMVRHLNILIFSLILFSCGSNKNDGSDSSENDTLTTDSIDNDTLIYIGHNIEYLKTDDLTFHQNCKRYKNPDTAEALMYFSRNKVFIEQNDSLLIKFVSNCKREYLPTLKSDSDSVEINLKPRTDKNGNVIEAYCSCLTEFVIKTDSITNSSRLRILIDSKRIDNLISINEIDKEFDRAFSLIENETEEE